jgi:hypothetical protein
MLAHVITVPVVRHHTVAVPLEPSWRPKRDRLSPSTRLGDGRETRIVGRYGVRCCLALIQADAGSLR